MQHFYRLSILLLTIFSCAKNNTPASDKLAEKAEPYDLFAFQRSFPDRDFDWKGWRKAVETARQSAAANERGAAGCSGNSVNWTLQGPANVAGRVNTLAVKPDDEDTVLAGFSAGGIFKTTDGGVNWHPVFDNAPELSIGDIVFDPADPNIVYAGTGDPNMPSTVFNGDGIFKSTDAGETWQHLGLAQQGIISKIQIDPTNPQIIYVATMGNPYLRDNERGIYKSTDGGQTWTQSLFVSNQAGASDLIINPVNPQILYASFWDRIRNNQESVLHGPHARVYKTTNGGQTWTQLGGGLPTGVMGRTGLAMSEQNPDKLYVVYIDSLATPGGLFKTVNGGDTWTSVNIDALENKCANFGWYFGKIKLSPTNDEEIYFHAIIMWRKAAGSNTWLTASGGHADSHDLAFTPSGRRYWANDGGVYRNDPGQQFWTKCKNLPTTQFYRTNFNLHFPNTYYAGAQDNGIQKGNGTDINNWISVYPADGFRSAFHPTDPNTFWVEVQNGTIHKTTDGGTSWQFGQTCFGTDDRCNWDAPFFLSPHHPEKLFAATYRVYISSNGTTWSAISDDLTDGIIYGARFHNISCLNESPILPDKLVAGTSDGNVWRRDPTGGWVKISTGLPDRYVTSVHCSPSFTNRIFTTHSGYRDNEYIPHIHRSDNNGQTWTDISSNLPPIPVNDLLVWPGHADSVLFAATDAGVYFSTSSGNSWARLGGNMPFIPVFDLEQNPVRKELVAATYARGIWTMPFDSVFVQQNPVTVSVDGQVATETSTGVANVSLGGQTTGANGIFSINGLPGCQPYTLSPYRNDAPLNGVSTWDLVLISKHILNLEPLNSPYKLIAADANKSNSVTTFDIVTIRRIILGIDTAFTSNTSWRFVPTDFQFPNLANPFQTPFPETLDVQLQTLPLGGLDFTAIKVGDVNNSATPSLTAQTEERTAGEWPIFLQNTDFEKNKNVTAVFSGAMANTAGVQFTTQFDAQKLVFEKIEPLLPGLSDANFGTNRSADGLLTVSFENPSALSSDESKSSSGLKQQPLFRIIFRAKTAGNLAKNIWLANWPTPALAFQPDGTTWKPVLKMGIEQSAPNTSVRAWPNPFGRGGVWLQIPSEAVTDSHPVATFITVQIIDAQGKVIFQKQLSKSETEQPLFFPADVFPEKGVYFYKIGKEKNRVGKLVFAP